MRMTVGDFYRDTRRRLSEESTFGVEWTSYSDPAALYGVHWLKDTKELYLLRGPILPPFLSDGFPLILNEVAPRFANDQYEVILLGKVRRASVVERALKGWSNRMGEPDSLRWALGRLDALVEPTL